MIQSSFWLPRVLEKKVLFFDVFNGCLFLTLLHRIPILILNMIWNGWKENRKEMKWKYQYLPFNSTIAFYFVTSMNWGVCSFFLLSNCDLTKLMNICFWKHNLEWKRSFSSKKPSVACAIGPSFTTSSTDFSFQNLIFLNFFWIFSGRNHLKINISQTLNPNLTK
jgi:hypothetical protein